jgi:DNA-binding transcriptional MocR family regulator
VDAFTIMRIAVHSSIVASQRYIHPTPEAVERAFERLQVSVKVVAITPKIRLPTTVSATLEEREAVSY